MVRPNAFAVCLALIASSGAALPLVGCSKSASPPAASNQPKVSPPPVKPPSDYIWEPNPTWLPQMTQIGDLGKYQVSLMKDFVPVDSKRQLPDNTKIYSWKGVAEGGQLQPIVTFTIWKDDKKILAEAKEDMRKMLVNFTKGTANTAGFRVASVGGLDKGTLGGIDFGRSKWLGITRDNVTVDGITYGAVDGSTVIAIIAISFGNGAEKSSRLLETTIATFKRK